MTNEPRLQKAVKALGMVGMALVTLFVVLIVPLVLLVPYIHGMVWFSVKAFAWLFYGGAIAFAICLLVLLPLSIFRKLRPWTGFGIFLSSYLFGTLLFAFSCLVALQLWGYVGLIIGLLLAGGGVVPVAFLAALFHGEWALLGFVVLGTVLTFGTRLLGLRWAGSTTPEQDEFAVEAGAG